MLQKSLVLRAADILAGPRVAVDEVPQDGFGHVAAFAGGASAIWVGARHRVAQVMYPVPHDHQLVLCNGRHPAGGRGCAGGL